MLIKHKQLKKFSKERPHADDKLSILFEVIGFLHPRMYAFKSDLCHEEWLFFGKCTLVILKVDTESQNRHWQRCVNDN